MSEREYLDLSDGPQEDAPAAAGEWDEDLLSDFPDDDPAASADTDLGDLPEDSDLSPATDTTAAATKKDKAKTKTKTGKYRSARKRRRSGGGGFLSFLLVLLGGLTLGSGLITATGVQPEALLDFSGFRDPLTIGDFRTYPVNAFWLAAGVMLFAGFLAAVAFERRLQGLVAQAEEDAAILGAIRQLDPDRPETWQSEELQHDPELAAVTSGLLGHFNLQQAKLSRYVGLEGEMHRLEKAMADANVTDLGGQWESPPVGALADLCHRILRDVEETRTSAASQVSSLASQGPELVGGLQDARSWHAGTLEHLTQHGGAVERVARHLGKLAQNLPEGDESRTRQRDRLRQALVAVQAEFANLPTRGGQSDTRADDLGGLVERASRLAFQIAMEVARLGTKGERLLPLTQDLEELTTALRKSTDAGAKDDANAEERVIENVRGRLAELDPAILEDGGEDELTAAVRQLAPTAGENAAKLAQLAKTFGVQTARIDQLLRTASELTGVEVVGGGDAEAAPGASLPVEQYDPFGTETAPASGLVADPFARSGGSIFDADAAAGGDFQQAALPGVEEALEPTKPTPEVSEAPAAATGPAAVTDVALDSDAPGASMADIELPMGSTQEIELPPVVDTATAGVPSADEKIYDLAEFDAVPLPPELADDEPVYELAEFGAERIG